MQTTGELSASPGKEIDSTFSVPMLILSPGLVSQYLCQSHWYSRKWFSLQMWTWRIQDDEYSDNDMDHADPCHCLQLHVKRSQPILACMGIAPCCCCLLYSQHAMSRCWSDWMTSRLEQTFTIRLADHGSLEYSCMGHLVSHCCSAKSNPIQNQAQPSACNCTNAQFVLEAVRQAC